MATNKNSRLTDLTLKRILNYSRHWMKARGRHGTHSPFVYAFVEQVLRNKNKISTRQVRQARGWPARWSLRERKLLYKTLYFLKPAQVLLPADGALDWMGAVLTGIVPAAALVTDDGTGSITGKQPQLLVVPAAQLSPARLQAAMRDGIGVLVLHPHQRTCPKGSWEVLYTDTQVKMSLDYWHFGLLLNDEAFKHKQHFRLR